MSEEVYQISNETSEITNHSPKTFNEISVTLNIE